MNILCQRILKGERPSFSEIIGALSPILPLLLQLESTPQDQDWHAEGNVYIHTEMVLQAIYNIIEHEAKNLSNDDKLSLILAAVLHDIAKSLTTKSMEIRGVMRIAAPKHEYRGASYIAYKLPQLGLPFTVCYKVIELVALHIVPKLLVVKSMPAARYYGLSRLVNLELVYYLEKADMLGRECVDRAEQLSHIELFKEFAQEYQIWSVDDYYRSWRIQVAETLKGYSDETKDLVIGNAILRAEKGQILTIDEELARSFSYRDKFAQLVILCGPSGAGKSTWVRNNLANFDVISLDCIRKELTGSEEDQSKNGQVLQAAKNALKVALRSHKNVVWDATNLRRDFRSIIAELGYAYKALVTLVVFYTREEYFLAKNQCRSRNVPLKVVQNQLDRLEWPEANEAHKYVVVGEQGEVLYTSK